MGAMVFEDEENWRARDDIREAAVVESADVERMNNASLGMRDVVCMCTMRSTIYLYVRGGGDVLLVAAL